MATWLKQSTAVDIKMGPFLDETDGKTAETGLTITQPDIRLAKNGGAWAQKNAAQTLSHEEAGWYEVALDTTDTNTLGILIVAIHESGALPVWREFLVVPANVYDSVVAGSDTLDVQVTGIGNDVITAASIAASAIGAAELADGAITAAKIATGAIDADAIADGAIDAGAIADGAITAAKVATGAIDADALAADAANEIADALLDRSAGVETGLTFRQWLRLAASALFGKASGLDTTTAVYRDFGDSKDRITATVDANGNRSAVTTDAT